MDVEEEEQEDIYFDLPQFDLGNENAKLRAQNDAYETEISILKTKVATLTLELTQLRELRDKERQIFSVNISELYKTAKAENDRKDRQIAELRRQLDDLIFKRNRGNYQNKRPREEEPNVEVPVKRLKENVPVPQESEHSNWQGTGWQDRQESRHCEKEVNKDEVPRNEKKPRSRSREAHRKRNNGEKSRSSSKDRRRNRYERHRDEQKNGFHRDHHKRDVSPSSHRSTPEALRHISHKNGRNTPEKDRSTLRTDTKTSSTREHCDGKRNQDRLSDVDIFEGLVVIDDKLPIPKRGEKSVKNRLKENSGHDKSRSSSTSSKLSHKSESSTKSNDLTKEIPKNEKADQKYLPDLRQRLITLKDESKDKTLHDVKGDERTKQKEDNIAIQERTCAEMKGDRLGNGTNDNNEKPNHEISSSVRVIRRYKLKTSPKKPTSVQKAFASLMIKRDKMKKGEWKCSNILDNGAEGVVGENVEEGEIIEEETSRQEIAQELMCEQIDAKARRIEETSTKQDRAKLDERKGSTVDREQKRGVVEVSEDKRVEEIQTENCAKLEENEGTRRDQGPKRGIEEPENTRATEGEAVKELESVRLDKHKGGVEERLAEQNRAKLEELEGGKVDQKPKRGRVEEPKSKMAKEGEAVEELESVRLDEHKGGVEERLAEQNRAKLEELKGGKVDQKPKRGKVDKEPKRGRVDEEPKRGRVEEPKSKMAKEGEAVEELESVRLDEHESRIMEDTESLENTGRVVSSGIEVKSDGRLKEQRSVEVVEEELARLVEQTGGMSTREEQNNGRAEESPEENLRAILEEQDDRRVEERERVKEQDVRAEISERTKERKEEMMQKPGTPKNQNGKRVEMQKGERVEAQKSRRVETQTGRKVEEQKSKRVEQEQRSGKLEEQKQKSRRGEQESRKVEEYTLQRMKEYKSTRRDECERMEQSYDTLQKQKIETLEKQKCRRVEEQKGRKVEENRGRRVEEQRSGRVEQQNIRRVEEKDRRLEQKDRRLEQKDRRLEQKEGRLEEHPRKRLEESKRERVKCQNGENVEMRKEDKKEKRQEEKRKEKLKQEQTERKPSTKEAQKPDTEDEEDNLENIRIEALLARRKFELEMLQKNSKETKKSSASSSAPEVLNSAGGFASQVFGVSEKSGVENKTSEESCRSSKKDNMIDSSGVQQTPKEIRSPRNGRPEENPRSSRPEGKPRVSRLVEKPRVVITEEEPVVTRPEKNTSIIRPAENPRVDKLEENPRVSGSEEKPRVSRLAEEPRLIRTEEEPVVTRPEESPSITRPEEKPRVARLVEEFRATRPEEKPTVTRSGEKPRATRLPEEQRMTRSGEKTRVIRPPPKSKFRRNLEAVTKHLFTTAEKERGEPEESPSERVAPAAPKQSVLESILNSKTMNESDNHRTTKSLFDTPCKNIADKNEPEFHEPKKDRRKSNPIARKRKSKDVNDDSGPPVKGEEPPRRVLRSQTKAMRVSPDMPKQPLSISPIKRPESDRPQKSDLLFQDLNISDMNLNPENLLTYDLSHDGAIPCLHISDSFNNIQLEQYSDIARNFDVAVASTPLALTAEQMRAQLKEDLGTSSSSDSKLTPDVKTTKVQPDAQKPAQQPSNVSVPGSNVSTVRRRRRCIVTLVD